MQWTSWIIKGKAEDQVKDLERKKETENIKVK